MEVIFSASLSLMVAKTSRLYFSMNNLFIIIQLRMYRCFFSIIEAERRLQGIKYNLKRYNVFTKPCFTAYEFKIKINDVTTKILNMKTRMVT